MTTTTSNRLTALGLLLAACLCVLGGSRAASSSNTDNKTVQVSPAPVAASAATSEKVPVGAPKSHKQNQTDQDEEPDEKSSAQETLVGTSSEATPKLALAPQAPTKDVLPEEDDDELHPHRVEIWLDEHRDFVHDYFVRKATRQMIDDWFKLHSSTSTSTSTTTSTTTTSTTPSPASSSTTSTTTTTPTPSPHQRLQVSSSTGAAPPSAAQARPDQSANGSATTVQPPSSSSSSVRLLGQQQQLNTSSAANLTSTTTTTTTTGASNETSTTTTALPGRTSMRPNKTTDSSPASASTTAGESGATPTATTPIGQRGTSESTGGANSSSASSSASPWPLNVSVDNIKASTPWSSSSDLTTRAGGALTKLGAGSSTTVATTLAPNTTSGAANASLGRQTLAGVGGNGSSSAAPPMSLVEMIKDMNDEHLRIEDNVKEQASSLRHFIILCSVLVVLATSLVVALLISLCK